MVGVSPTSDWHGLCKTQLYRERQDTLGASRTARRACCRCCGVARGRWGERTCEGAICRDVAAERANAFAGEPNLDMPLCSQDLLGVKTSLQLG